MKVSTKDKIRNFPIVKWIILPVFRIIIISLSYVKLLFQSRICEKEVFREILLLKNESELFLTHSWGGGTELYVQNYLACHSNVTVIRPYTVHGKQIGLIVRFTDNQKNYLLKKNLLKRILCSKVWKVTINSFITFEPVVKLLCFFSTFRENAIHISGLVYNVHDFHCVCPSNHLVCNGWYCNLKCSDLNCVFAGKESCKIINWRNAWNEFLLSTDVIRCFSESSKEIVLKAYPSLAPEKCIVTPHDTSWISFAPISDLKKKPLHLGIVGACGTLIKGSQIVKKLLQQLPQSIPCSLIGTCESEIGVSAEHIKYIGRYKHDELQKLIEKENITIVFFPSICPETFSYTISELIAMNLPIICFNLGAQGERTSKYEKGTVVSSPEEVLKIIKRIQNI